MMLERLEQFLSMGGYGAYVWGAYGLCAVVMVLLAVITLRRLRAGERTLKMLDELRGSRRRQPGGNGNAS